MPQNHDELRPQSAFEKASPLQLRQYQGFAEQSSSSHKPPTGESCSHWPSQAWIFHSFLSQLKRKCIF